MQGRRLSSSGGVVNAQNIARTALSINTKGYRVSKLTWGNSSFKIKKTADSENSTQALCGEWSGHTGLLPCPVCQSQRRADQRGLSIRADGGTLLAFCHKSGCDFRDVVKAAGLPRDAMHVDPEAAAKREAYGGSNSPRRGGSGQTVSPCKPRRAKAICAGAVSPAPCRPRLAGPLMPYTGRAPAGCRQCCPPLLSSVSRLDAERLPRTRTTLRLRRCTSTMKIAR